jgi:cytochrome P450
MNSPAARTLDAIKYDLLDPALYLAPHAVFDAMRANDPVYFSPQLASWVLTRYEDVCAALRDPRLSVVEELKRMEGLSAADQMALQPLKRIFLAWGNRAAPEAHGRFIKLLKRYFTPSYVESQRPRIQRILDALIERALARETMDVVNDIAHPMAMTLMGEVLDLPADPDAVAMYLQCSNFISQLLEMGEREQLFNCQRGMLQIAEFVRPVIERRRQSPGAGLVDVFFQADPTGEDYTDDYIIAQVIMFLVVGYHTTANQLCNGLQLLFENPEERARIAADPSLLENAFEEMMRSHGAVASVRRMAKADLTIRDQLIREGETLVVVLAAANRDPAAFPDPARFDITRPEAGRQVGFTIGPFSCMGQALARLEAQVFFRTMLGRFPAMRARDARPDWINFRPFGRELRSLHVHTA